MTIRICERCGKTPCACTPVVLAREGLIEAMLRFDTLRAQWASTHDLDTDVRQKVLALAIFADQVKMAANALANVLGQGGARR